ncbi:hypothetical protein Tsubulata_049641 [Turnera subulata]|uniref:ATPase AAA-type core domain-containing protein n=1 Tax=Turnera subulata TaxID=218843 RepID=A0A9Q0IZG2_9ROSI|nr:hypothetical protein Tsubulata_049641 [Turnera subulata]
MEGRQGMERTGTGKSSLIAGRDNYLNFDIYDLELTKNRTNSELRWLLVSTGNKSILMVEEVDCSIELIIVFTTNHKEKLDTHLLRAGRMDMHIHLSYCNLGFKMKVQSSKKAIKTRKQQNNVEEECAMKIAKKE